MSVRKLSSRISDIVLGFEATEHKEAIRILAIEAMELEQAKDALVKTCLELETKYADACAENKRLREVIFHLDKWSSRADVYHSLLDCKSMEDASLIMSYIERIANPTESEG